MTFKPADWHPLEVALTRAFGSGAREATNGFWFIGYTEGPADVGELRLYEHQGTRRRLALDADGRAYRYYSDLDRYSPVSMDDAFVDALA